MLTVDRCRELLGDRADGMGDAQVVEVRDNLYALADLLIDMYLKEGAPLRAKTDSPYS